MYHMLETEAKMSTCGLPKYSPQHSHGPRKRQYQGEKGHDVAPDYDHRTRSIHKGSSLEDVTSSNISFGGFS